MNYKNKTNGLIAEILLILVALIFLTYSGFELANLTDWDYLQDLVLKILTALKSALGEIWEFLRNLFQKSA